MGTLSSLIDTISCFLIVCLRFFLFYGIDSKTVSVVSQNAAAAWMPLLFIASIFICTLVTSKFAKLKQKRPTVFCRNYLIQCQGKTD